MPSRQTIFALTLIAAPAFSNGALAQDVPLPPQPQDKAAGVEIYERQNLIFTYEDHDIWTRAMNYNLDVHGGLLLTPLSEFNFVNIRCAGVNDQVPRFNLDFQMIKKEAGGGQVGYEQNMRDRAEPFVDETGHAVSGTVLSRSFAVSGDKMRVLDRPEDFYELLQDLKNGRWNTSGVSTIENSARFLSEVRKLCLNLG